MPHGITRVTPSSNRTSTRIEQSSDVITAVIPRDTSTGAERYIIFTGGAPLPDVTKNVLADIQSKAEKDFEIRALSGHDDPERKDEQYTVHAIGYENKETRERATYLLF